MVCLFVRNKKLRLSEKIMPLVSYDLTDINVKYFYDDMEHRRKFTPAYRDYEGTEYYRITTFKVPYARKRSKAVRLNFDKDGCFTEFLVPKCVTEKQKKEWLQEIISELLEYGVLVFS